MPSDLPFAPDAAISALQVISPVRFASVDEMAVMSAPLSMSALVLTLCMVTFTLRIGIPRSVLTMSDVVHPSMVFVKTKSV